MLSSIKVFGIHISHWKENHTNSCHQFTLIPIVVHSQTTTKLLTSCFSRCCLSSGLEMLCGFTSKWFGYNENHPREKPRDLWCTPTLWLAAQLRMWVQTLPGVYLPEVSIRGGWLISNCILPIRCKRITLRYVVCCLCIPYIFYCYSLSYFNSSILYSFIFLFLYLFILLSVYCSTFLSFFTFIHFSYYSWSLHLFYSSKLRYFTPSILLSFCPYTLKLSILLAFYSFLLLSFYPSALLSFYPYILLSWCPSILLSFCSSIFLSI